MSIPAIPLPDARFDVRANHEARILESRITVDEPPPPPVIADAKEDASRPPPAPISDDDAEDEVLFRMAFRDSSALYPPPSPPPVSYDEAEDGALFRVAARVSSKPRRPKKPAFMFLTTTGLPFVFKNTPGELYNIYVHAEPTRRPGPHFTSVFSGRVIPSKPSSRHTPTLILAAPRLLARALLHDPGNTMFAFLSPSCVPLRSFNFTNRTLATSRRSFIEILKNEPGRYDRREARGPDAMLPKVPLADFWIGSQFWALTRWHAR